MWGEACATEVLETHFRHRLCAGCAPGHQTNFVAYSSIVFAVLGLRALYFVLEGLEDRFAYLHYGLAAILVFLGTKFVAQGFGLQVPILASLLVIAGVVTAAIVVSLMATHGRRPGGGGSARGASWCGLVYRIMPMVHMPLEIEGGKE